MKRAGETAFGTRREGKGLRTKGVGGTLEREGGGIEGEIKILLPCVPAGYCSAVRLTKAISGKQQVGMKI